MSEERNGIAENSTEPCGVLCAELLLVTYTYPTDERRGAGRRGRGIVEGVIVVGECVGGLLFLAINASQEFMIPHQEDSVSGQVVNERSVYMQGLGLWWWGAEQ